MDKKELSKRLLYAIYNIKDLNNFKELNMNMSRLGMLYMISNETNCSQKLMSEKLGIPVTTVNTIIKKWEQDKLIELVQSIINKKEMNILLTDKGKNYVQNIMNIIDEVEEEAIKTTIAKYTENFVDAIEYYAQTKKDLLNKRMAEQYETDK